MSTDLKIDHFAQDLFTALWRQHGLWRELLKSNRPPSDFNGNILRAVEARQALFHTVYEEIFERSHADFVGNWIGFYHAIADTFPHSWSEEEEQTATETVMNVFLLSCAFVADMCMWCKSRGDDFLGMAHKAWAMYVDANIKDSFYAVGGWNELRVFAESDIVVYDYVRTFSDLANCSLGKNVLVHETHLTIAAVESFQEFVDWTQDCFDEPLALAWMDYCVLTPHAEVRPPCYFKEKDPVVCMEIEDAVVHLGMFCRSYYFDMDDSDVSCAGNDDSEDGESGTASSAPTTPSIHIDTRKNTREFLARLNSLKSRDPESNDQVSKKPVHIVNSRLASAEDDENSSTDECRNSATTKEKQGASFIQMNDEKSEVAEVLSQLRGLRASSEGPTDPKISGESNLQSEIDNALNAPTTSKMHIDTRKSIRELLDRSNSLELSDPENIAQDSEKPVHISLASADGDKAPSIDEDKDSECRNSVTAKENQRESFIETDEEKTESEIAEFLSQLRASSEGPTDSKALKRDESNLSLNQNVMPASSASLESRIEADKGFKEVSGLLSIGVSVIPSLLDPENYSAGKDKDNSLPHKNTEPNDFEAIMNQLGLKKVQPSDSKSRVEEYVQSFSPDDIEPDNIVQASEKSENIIRLASAENDKISSIDMCRNSVTAKEIQGESFIQMNNEKSEIAEFLSQLRGLRASSEGPTDPKALKEGESNLSFNQNVMPTSSASLESRAEANKGLKEVSGVLSIGVSVIPSQLDPANFSAGKDRDSSLPHKNTDPNDFEAIMNQLGLKKVQPSDTKRRAEVYVRSISPDDIEVPHDGVEVPKLSSLTPRKCPFSPSNIMNIFRKSPLNSTNISITNTPYGTLYKRMDSPGSSGKKRRTRFNEKENFPPCDAKDEIKTADPGSSVSSVNVKRRKSGDKSSFSLKDLSISKAETDDYHMKQAEEQSFKDDSDDDLVMLAKHNLKTYGRRKEVKLESKTNSSSEAPPGFLNSSFAIDDELHQILEKPLKTLESEGKIDLQSASTEKGLNLNPPHCRTCDISSQTRIVETSSCSKELEKSSKNYEENRHILEKSLKTLDPELKNDLQRIYTEELNLNPSHCKINDISSQTRIVQTCSKELEKSSENDKENSHILEKSLEILEPAEDNYLLSTFTGKKYELVNRQESQDSCSTEIYQLADIENSSAEPTMVNPFQFAPGDSGPKSTLETKQDESIQKESILNGETSAPQDSVKKGKKKSKKKRLTRLEQRVKEDGDAIYDVMRLIFVMGHRPGLVHVASTSQYCNKKKSKSEE